MILGVGSDLIDVRRIERTIERHGERFLGRIFTPLERAKAEGRVRRVESLSVADASIMPTIPRANTNLPTQMIAEKLAAIRLAN